MIQRRTDRTLRARNSTPETNTAPTATSQASSVPNTTPQVGYRMLEPDSGSGLAREIAPGPLRGGPSTHWNARDDPRAETVHIEIIKRRKNITFISLMPAMLTAKLVGRSCVQMTRSQARGRGVCRRSPSGWRNGHDLWRHTNSNACGVHTCG